ncbi:MAG: hypothetical protein K2G86_10250, partial [Prevotella sp.]|nr:hypothetical protein [Prevotella sp.]
TQREKDARSKLENFGPRDFYFQIIDSTEPLCRDNSECVTHHVKNECHETGKYLGDIAGLSKLFITFAVLKHTR